MTTQLLNQAGVAVAPPTGNSKIKFNADGALCIRLTNRTGVASVKGTVIVMDSSNDFSFVAAPGDSYVPCGIVEESGIANAQEAWVVIRGKAQVLLEDSTASTRGYWVKMSNTAGRANATTSAPPVTTLADLQTHMKEIGMCEETKTGGTNVLAYVTVNFN